MNWFLLPAYAAAVKPQRCCSPQCGAAGRSDAGTDPDLHNPAGIPALTPAKRSQDIRKVEMHTESADTKNNS